MYSYLRARLTVTGVLWQVFRTRTIAPNARDWRKIVMGARRSLTSEQVVRICSMRDGDLVRDFKLPRMGW
jgi:hypothetical protein